MAAVFFSGHAVLKVGGVNLTVADIFLMIAAAVFIGQRRFNLAPFGSMTPIWLLGLAAMLGGLFVSTLANGDPIRWVNIASQYSVAFLVLPVILMAVERRFARQLVLIYVAGIVVSQVIGILAFNFLSWSDTRFLSPGFIAGNGRVGAMAGEPNPNGATIAFALAMLVYAARKKMIRPLLAAALGGILLWGLLLAASVTGFTASLIAVVIVLGVIGMGRLLKVALVLAVGVTLYLGSGAPLPKAFEKRVAVAITSGDVSRAGSFKNRSELMQEAWVMAEDNIFYGLGADRYREVSEYGAPVHNLHLLIWNEGGALAYAGLLLMLGLMVVLALAGLRERREEAAMALAVIAVLLIYTNAAPHMYSRFWVLPAILALSTMYARPSRAYVLMPGGDGVPRTAA
jgi:O-antigen ligase